MSQVTPVFVCVQMYISNTKGAVCQRSPLNNERNPPLHAQIIAFYGFLFLFLKVYIYSGLCAGVQTE